MKLEVYGKVIGVAVLDEYWKGIADIADSCGWSATEDGSERQIFFPSLPNFLSFHSSSKISHPA